MICEICGKEFKKPSGHGGQNRKICFVCLPDGLSKPERDKVRYRLYSDKNIENKLKLGCALCGYNKCPDALEWHHTENKDGDPSYIMKKSWDTFKKELEKCILLCANCHRQVHYNK